MCLEPPTGQIWSDRFYFMLNNASMTPRMTSFLYTEGGGAKRILRPPGTDWLTDWPNVLAWQATTPLATWGPQKQGTTVDLGVGSNGWYGGEGKFRWKKASDYLWLLVITVDYCEFPWIPVHSRWFPLIPKDYWVMSSFSLFFGWFLYNGCFGLYTSTIGHQRHQLVNLWRPSVMCNPVNAELMSQSMQALVICTKMHHVGLVLHACHGPPLHTDFTHRLHLSKSHHRTSVASGRLPFTYSILIFHFHFIWLFHILNLEPKSSSEQTSVGFHWTPTRITYSYIYCRITCRYSVRISTWFSQISLWLQV